MNTLSYEGCSSVRSQKERQIRPIIHSIERVGVCDRFLVVPGRARRLSELPMEFSLAPVRRGRFGLIFLAEQMNDLFVQVLNHIVRLLFCP
jgi:hypothetical protein